MRWLLALAVLACTGLGQSYALRSAVVDDGGRRAGSGGYVLQFSLAQTFASDLLTSQGYRATIGFWHGPYPPGGIQAGPEQEVTRLALAVTPSLVTSRASIRYALPAESEVVLSVLDYAGRLTARLVSGRQAAGRYVARWDVSSAPRDRLPNSIYFVRLEAGERVLVRKLVVAR
jgi:hypothetical protein